jgi:hypothetical protein
MGKNVITVGHGSGIGIVKTDERTEHAIRLLDFDGKMYAVEEAILAFGQLNLSPERIFNGSVR